MSLAIHIVPRGAKISREEPFDVVPILHIRIGKVPSSIRRHTAVLDTVVVPTPTTKLVPNIRLAVFLFSTAFLYSCKENVSKDITVTCTILALVEQALKKKRIKSF